MVQDIIQLLPDNIANQIAAGEVIQRPASAVKELLENAIDAGATRIHLIIKDAGKELIQVTDNGKGMSHTDARLCFERHATSKIKTIHDLFSIRTMGFRGEALASIAAVAQVELKSKLHDQNIGTQIAIENSIVKSQEPCSCNSGTSIQVKNLFFNVPARRHFLKSTSTETKHIIDEFIRIALAFPEIEFTFTNNNTQIFHVESGKLKQRILGLLGNTLNTKLIPVEEKTEYIHIHGFVGLPDAATKTRGNQFFFVNNRFIKSAYLNFALNNAFRELIAKDEFPLFILFIDINPDKIDINVHPTKQEIKFDDEKIIFSFINAAVKHALSKHSVAPSLDFNLDPTIQNLSAITQPFLPTQKVQTEKNYLYQSFTQKGQAHFLEKKEDIKNWKELYKIQDALPENNVTQTHAFTETPLPSKHFFLQVNNAYIIATTKSGFVIINQHLAHQRVLYEQYSNREIKPLIQKCLLPQTIHLHPSDAVLLNHLLPDLETLGYQLEPFGNNTFIIQGIPQDVQQGTEKEGLEKLIEELKQGAVDMNTITRERLLLALCKQKAIPAGKKLFPLEMEDLINKLFSCSLPTLSPSGKKIMITLQQEAIEQLINNA